MLPFDCHVHTVLSNFLKCIPCFPFPPSSSFILPTLLLLPIEEIKRCKIIISHRKCNVHKKSTLDHTVGHKADFSVGMLMTLNNLNLQSELFSLKVSKPTYDFTLRAKLHHSRSCRSWPLGQWQLKPGTGQPTCLCHTFGCSILYFPL